MEDILGFCLALVSILDDWIMNLRRDEDTTALLAFKHKLKFVLDHKDANAS